MPNRWFGGATSYRNGPCRYPTVYRWATRRIAGLVILDKGLSFIFLHVNFKLSPRTKVCCGQSSWGVQIDRGEE